MSTTVDDARKRLKAGASDAEVRLELLSRGLTAEEISEVMREATPRVAFNGPYLAVGLGTCALAAGLLATTLSASVKTGDFTATKALAVLAALGVAITLRGFKFGR